MAERKFLFDIKQTIRTKSGVAGVIVDRQAGEDAISFRDARGLSGAMESLEVRTPVNAYQVTFLGDHGLADSAWWHEDMIEAVAV